MRALMIPAAMALSVSFSAGCNHITTKVPGVLDLRSDGSDTPTNPTTSGAGRGEFDAVLWGSGVQGASADVSVVDRKYWLLRLIPIANESATEEIAAAIGDNGALRNVTIGEAYTPMDFGVAYFGALVPVVGQLCGGLVLPPFDVKLTGTRIKPASSSSLSSGVSPLIPGEPSGEPVPPLPPIPGDL